MFHIFEKIKNNGIYMIAEMSANHGGSLENALQKRVYQHSPNNVCTWRLLSGRTLHPRVLHQSKKMPQNPLAAKHLQKRTSRICQFLLQWQEGKGLLHCHCQDMGTDTSWEPVSSSPGKVEERRLYFLFCIQLLGPAWHQRCFIQRRADTVSEEKCSWHGFCK